jgi:hypothetical protein
MIEHEVLWTAPSPLWLEATAFDGFAAQRQMREPAILRFAADSFMEDFLKIMETDPDKLRSLVAIQETWRGPAEQPEADALLEPAEPSSSFARRLSRARLVTERTKTNGSLIATLRNGAAGRTAPLKLYQSAHQRFYLVSACLVCGIAGLPDRALDPAKEKVSFVIRRLLPPVIPPLDQDLPDVDMSTWTEYGMIAAPGGAGWQKIERASGATPSVVLPGEERLALFPMSFVEDDGRKRRLFAGLVPVGKRESYMGGPLRAPGAPAPQAGSRPSPHSDPRMSLVWTQVTEPWKQLIEQAAATGQLRAEPTSAAFTSTAQSDQEKAQENIAALKASREQIQIPSWYILLDFAKLLKEHLPNVIKKIAGESVFLNAPQTALVNALNAAALPPRLLADLALNSFQPPVRTLADALVGILGGAPLNQHDADVLEDRLEKVSVPYDRLASDAARTWAPFIFPLADAGVLHIDPNGVLVPQDDTVVGPFPSGAPDPLTALNAALAQVDNLANVIYNALPPLPAGPMPALPIGSEPPLDPREGWFVIRCVFERPDCGPLEPAVVSPITRPFQMAGFFDSDAPARPIRIALPMDTSPAGLRKFDKKAAFMMSDILCGQVNSAKGLTLGSLVRSVLPWPFHKDLSASMGSIKPCKSGGVQAGMICTLSIPIITICALILLMIIVNLFDLIFRWIPYFLVCFPLPGFKAKKS